MKSLEENSTWCPCSLPKAERERRRNDSAWGVCALLPLLVAVKGGMALAKWQDIFILFESKLSTDKGSNLPSRAGWT